MPPALIANVASATLVSNLFAMVSSHDSIRIPPWLAMGEAANTSSAPNPGGCAVDG